MKKIITLTTFLFATSAIADDVQIGEATNKNGMEIAAVYIQPVIMEPDHSTTADKADIHLEADIKALKDNANGFTEGSWVPYLSINYELKQKGKDWQINGVLMPMVASDGPHYGNNVALNGAGKYQLKLSFASPKKTHFMRHIDKETGVAPWWEDFELNYDFNWIGSTGKKGGY